MSVVTKQIKDFNTSTNVEDDSLIVLQTSSGTTLNSTKETFLKDTLKYKKIELSNLSNSVEILDTFDDTIAIGCKWVITVNDGSNFRISEILSIWNESTDTLKFTETSTNDIGDTSDILFACDVSNNDVRLLVSISNGTWDFNIQRILI